MFGKGMMKKVLMYMIMGPIGLLLGGKFNIMDLLMIPMLVPMFSGLFGGLGLGNLGGGGTTVPAGGNVT